MGALVSLLEELGVEVRLNAPVEEILVRDGRARGVRVQGGEEVAAELVVSNADPSYVYSRMLAPAGVRPGADPPAVGLLPLPQPLGRRGGALLRRRRF